MFLRYGAYTFANDSVEVSMQIQTLNNDRGVPYAQIRMANVKGYLDGSNTIELSASAALLASALATPFLDFGLFTDAGLLSHVAILNSGSTTGVTLSGPNFDTGKGAELATLRSFSFTVRAEYPLSPGVFVLQSFSERISMTGTGGPRFVIREALTGLPQKQYTSQRTKCRATQSGTAVGYLSEPIVPTPLWPNDEKLDERSITWTSPKFRGGGFQDYAVNWSYNFEANFPFIGYPNKA